jgi:Sulfatase
MKAKTILMGCGAAVVAVMPYTWPLFSPHHYALYHSLHSLDNMIWAALLDFIVIGVLAALFFYYLERRRGIDRSVIWAVVAARLAAALAQVHSTSQRQTLRHVSMEIAFGVTLLVFLALRWVRPRVYQGMAKGFAILLLLAGVNAAWIVPELLYFGLRHKGPDAVLADSSSGRDYGATATSLNPHRRIVWLVFDELSYRQTFEHRFPGLAMPAFDQLRSESFLFESLQPAASYTDVALPALFLGKGVDDIKSDLDGRAILKLSGQNRWSVLDPQATVFGEAQRNGWSSGVVGWWNPYCRILPNTLDYCYWTTEETNGIFSTDRSVLSNAAAPFLSKLGPTSTTVEEKHQASILALMEKAQALIANEKIQFLFIHLPIPHPPGIYDRTTGKLRDSGTYIDNLALADRSLGKLMNSLNATASAANTTVIVCSDHSWRVPMWKSDANWSAEDEAASQGKFDPRPVLMVHFPQQSHEVAISKPFDQIALHAIIVSMLQGRIESPAEFQAWIDNATNQNVKNVAQK